MQERTTILEKIFPFLKKKTTDQQGKVVKVAPVSGKGFLVFAHTGEVIAAQNCLKEKGFVLEVKGPPPELRTGCDMVLLFPLVEELRVRTTLKEHNLEPLQILPVQDILLEPVSLYHIKDYGDWLMVRAANMKITIEKSSRRIVNISGGGCPDVPYLANLLIGKILEKAPEPQIYGQTLCGYALHLAFKEMVRRCRG